MTKHQKVAIVEPFYSGSHKYWVDSLKKYFSTDIQTFTLPGRHWKWRMTAGFIELAEQVNQHNQFDVFLVSDMLDVLSFKAFLNPGHQSTSIVLYMHENQVVYPFRTPEGEKHRDRHYGFINYKSVLCADKVLFNSQFHFDSFFDEMEKFLFPFPDSKPLIRRLQEAKPKCSVQYLGIELNELNRFKTAKNRVPTILWNHRWEHDKNPELFFKTLMRLSLEGFDFQLIVCGEQYEKAPAIFEEARTILAKHIVHWGYFDSREDYTKALWQSTILPVTSNQEFFGLSVLEASACHVLPILPNRLSYPELYQGIGVFYNSDEEFYEFLKSAIEKNEVPDFGVFAERFDWEGKEGTILTPVG
ncbi:MAG: DUF3524 domain-containing protein [Flavobacteriales bacterium]|nr:DUF3524 domain-containing protein [Flavobacteriales bacterium]